MKAGIAPYIAEFLASFLFTIIGLGSILVGATSIGVALAHGFAFSALIYAIVRTSGAVINLAITLALLATNQLLIVRAILYIFVQILGAIIGVLLLRQIFGESCNAETIVPTLGISVAPDVGLLVELILTFALVFTYLNTNNASGYPGIKGVSVGLIIIANMLWARALTGAAMNPALAFGPSLITGAWENHWIYWLGPIIGSLLAALIYSLDVNSRNKTEIDST
ncbi:MAG: Aquaporin Z 2 [bacterium ADurb.Bin400]|nr:MAG: Aquaporin Z 2 [bacterium ADurb.Bin400]